MAGLAGSGGLSGGDSGEPVAGSLLPSVTQANDLGSASKAWNYAYVAAIRDQSEGNNRVVLFTNQETQVKGDMANSGSNVAVKFGNTASLNALTSIAGFYSDSGITTKVAGIHNSGRLDLDFTNGSATPGAATINKPSGQVAIAIGAASVVVTNSIVSATSIVIAVLQFVDATLTEILSVVPGAGTFTITGNANATAATKVGFVVFNP